jgi:carboxyl-terminal processing protease
MPLRQSTSVKTIGATLIVLILMLGSFYAGDIARPYTTLPGLHQTKLDFSSLNDIYGMLKANFDGKVDDSKALEAAKAGLVSAAGDPYTVYLDPVAAKGLSNDLNGQVSGIGAEVGLKNNYLTVISPVPDTPAAQAGLRSGDIIAKIDGTDTTGLTVDAAVAKIRGKSGTVVTLTIVRPNTPAAEIKITRADITVPSITSSIKNGNIGYIQIREFGSDTSALIDKAATSVKAGGATKIILDLRDNPGGYLDAGVTVASEFLPQGKTIVSERTGGKTTATQTVTTTGQLIGLPTVVLVNGGSASASEIVSGALQDNKVATLVGVQTFGKGSVQEIKSLPGGAELKVTVAHWYTPNGVNIGKKGITPDDVIALTNDDYNNNRDPQLDKALDLLK